MYLCAVHGVCWICRCRRQSLHLVSHSHESPKRTAQPKSSTLRPMRQKPQSSTCRDFKKPGHKDGDHKKSLVEATSTLERIASQRGKLGDAGLNTEYLT